MLRTLTLTLLALGLMTGTALAQNAVSVPADGLFSRADAAPVCVATAASSTWTGHWNTTVWGQMSVCNCSVAGAARFDVEAGPIWNQHHARQVCPQVCGGAQWTGDFTSARRGAPSCTLAYAGRVQGVVHIAPVAFIPAVRVAPVVTPAPVVVVSPRPAFRPLPRHVVSPRSHRAAPAPRARVVRR